MNNATETSQEERLSVFQFTIIVLSLYVLGAVCVQTFFKLSPEMDALLNNIDTGICFIFLGDFFYRFYKAPSKLRFLKWGWIDFVSSIPLLDQLRWGRMVRVVRLFRILRAFRSTKVLLGFVFRNRAQSTFAAVTLTCLLLTIFSSIAMLNFETDPQSNIKTPEDALWWSSSTITTVGYGDKYPVTTEGRIVAVILMTAGVGLFGTFTAFVASSFLGFQQKREQAEIKELIAEVKRLHEKIETMQVSRK
ncbi:MAG: ion transporter [Verrucomicrobia bacterium]|nr:ion transporter [Verrucomicrobiota bacterium]